MDKQQRYAEAAALIRSWMNESDSGDEEFAKEIEIYLQRLDSFEGGRFIPCRGCPKQVFLDKADAARTGDT